MTDSSKKDFKNIFLHFLNFDTLEIFNINQRYSLQYFEKLLLKTILVGSLLAKDYLFLPLGFPFETLVCKKILKRLDCLRVDGLIRYAIKEDDLIAFISKKQKGYKSYKDLKIYDRFFSKKPERIYKSIAAPWIKRNTSIGNYCVNKFDIKDNEEFDYFFKPLFEMLPDSKSRKEFTNILSTFKADYGTYPFIWPSVREKLHIFGPNFLYQLRLIFEKIYYQAYINEFDATIILDLPFQIVKIGHP